MDSFGERCHYNDWFTQLENSILWIFRVHITSRLAQNKALWLVWRRRCAGAAATAASTERRKVRRGVQTSYTIEYRVIDAMKRAIDEGGWGAKKFQ